MWTMKLHSKKTNKTWYVVSTKLWWNYLCIHGSNQNLLFTWTIASRLFGKQTAAQTAWFVWFDTWCLRKTDTLGELSAIFCQKDNFSECLFAFMYTKPLLQWIYSQFLRTQIFEGGKNMLDKAITSSSDY